MRERGQLFKHEERKTSSKNPQIAILKIMIYHQKMFAGKILWDKSPSPVLFRVTIVKIFHQQTYRLTNLPLEASPGAKNW